MDCGATVRSSGGETCKLAPGHTGHHATIAFICDGCGKHRRGSPVACSRDGEYENGLGFCFLCVKQAERGLVYADTD